MGFVGHWFVGLFVLVFWLVAIVAIVFLVRMLLGASRPPAPAVSPHSKALEELDLRYARGEVNRAEYLERRADLGGGSPPPEAPRPPPSS
jgi:putative membrane protein